MVNFYIQEFKKYIGDFAILWKTDAKEAFDLLAKCTKYKFFAGKREGGLLKKIMVEDKVITGDEMAEAVINHYKEVHKLPANEDNINPNLFPFPNNFNISKNQVMKMFKRFKRDKAFCADGFNNEFFWLCSKCKSKNFMDYTLLCDNCHNLISFCTRLCDHNYWNDKKKAKWHFRAWLIPLNKAFPAIGKVNEYRAIVCVSSLIKFLEALLIDDLNDYLSNKLNKNQIGFVTGQEIGMNTARLIIKALILIEELKGKDENACFLFIDFSTAYDKVLRQKLYRKLKNKKILSINKMKLLKFIHHNISITYWN